MQYFLLSFYVPESHLDAVKNALFDAGAGKQGEHEQACWQTPGTGQFKPLAQANPAIGSIGHLTYVDEFKVEMLCSESNLHKVIRELKKTHPYEEPAFYVMRSESL